MRLGDIGSVALGGVTARLRRDAIAYGACGICGIIVIVLATSASVLALEPLVGLVYARLIVGGVFALIAGGIILGLRYYTRRPRATASAASHLHAAAADLNAGAGPARNAQFAQIAMLIEALMLGYALSRRSDRR